MKKCFLVYFTLVVIVSAFNSPFDLEAAEEKPQEFKVGEKITIPDKNIVKLAFYDTSNEKNLELYIYEIPKNEIQNSEWSLSPESIEKIRVGLFGKGKVNPTNRGKIKYGWLLEENVLYREGQEQFHAFIIEDEPTDIHIPISEEALTDTSPELQVLECKSPEVEALWRKWLGEITEDLDLRGEKGFVAILFNQELKICNVWPQESTVGDLIYVGVVIAKSEQYFGLAVDYSPCALEPEMPQLYISESFPQIGLFKDIPGFKIEKFNPKRCFNSVVNITVKRTDERKQVIREGNFILQQYKRYRGTLQLGVLSSLLHEESFGLKKEEEKTTVYSKGPVDRGPEYIASLVIYSFPRYIEGLLSPGKRFTGRDILHDNRLIDRIGAVIGVGLKNPGRRFTLGLSFELLYGVNIIGVYEFVRLKELVGLEEGDEFSGKEEELPTRDYWDNKFVFGLSIDLRYVTTLFSKK